MWRRKPQQSKRTRRFRSHPALEELEKRALPSVWIGGDSAAPTSWSDPGNWLDHAVPVKGSIVRFDEAAGTIKSYASNNDIPNLTLDSIVISSKSAFTIGGLALAISGGISYDSFDAASTLDFTAIQLAAANTWANQAGTLNIASQIDLAGYALTSTGAGATVIGGTIFGEPAAGHALIEMGPGTLTLAAPNDYLGGTTVTSGTIHVANTQALGTGAVTLAGGTLALAAGPFVQTYANDVVVTASSTIEVDSYPATLGALSIGSSVLTVMGLGPSLSSGPSLTLASTTLTGNAAFSPGPNFGQALNLGVVVNGAAATTLSVSGPGVVNADTIPGGVTLAGAGRLGRPVTIAAGAAVNPGTPAGAPPASAAGTIASVAGFSFASGAIDFVELGGASQGSFDQIVSSGTVNLNSDSGAGAVLKVALIGGFVPTKGQQFTIIQSSQSNPIRGTFAGLPEGASFLAAPGLDLTISYQGGAGHDVVLTAVVPGPATHFSVSPKAAAVAAGSPLTFIVSALDANNLMATGYQGSVKLSSPNDSQAVLPPVDALVNGSGALDVTFKTAGSQTLAAADTITPSLRGASPAVAVSPLAAVHFAITGLPRAIMPGGLFEFTVTAQDQFNNPASGYGGTVHFSSTDAQSILPVDAQLVGGTGVFSAQLNTSGPETLSAGDTQSPGITGTSAIVNVFDLADAETISYFKVAVPGGTQTTGAPFSVTVTAVSSSGATAVGYVGKVHFTSSDPSAVLPADAALTNGIGTFRVTLQTAGSQTLTASDSISLVSPPLITGTSGAIMTRGLIVTSFSATPTGFTATFSKPFVAAGVVLYGTNPAIRDVTLVNEPIGDGPTTLFPGTLIVDPTRTAITFKVTRDFLTTFMGSPVLPDGKYIVALTSGTLTSGTVHGFTDDLGVPLDGANVAGHADYVARFTVANEGKMVLALPDFARGPDENGAIKVPQNSAAGIPVTLYNAASVKDVTFNLSYNPALLTVTGAGTGDASAAGSTFSLVPTDPVPGIVTFTYHNDTPQSGTVVLGDLLAHVPNSAANLYKSKELLTVTSITVNGAPFNGISANGVHVNAYFGDVSGNGRIDALDVALANTVASGAAAGFNAFDLLDPALVGDIAEDAFVDATAVSLLAYYTVHLPTPMIPTIPGGLTIIPSGPDPTLSLGQTPGPGGGSSLALSVFLDHPRPEGSTGMIEAVLALTYDPHVLSVSPADIALGSIPLAGTGWQLISKVDQARGQIGIVIYSMTPIATDAPGNLVNIVFHLVDNGARERTRRALPTGWAQLADRVSLAGQEFTTQVDDVEGQLALSPWGSVPARPIRAARLLGAKPS